MPHPIEAKIAAAWPPSQWTDVTVVVGVSGGGDSVALVRAMAAIKAGAGRGRICAAHVNHHLRPEAADDERFVADLCRRLQIDCEVAHVDVGAAAARSGEGLEAAARRARYRFLRQAAGRFGARFVATAHTADDQAETILHRIVRGTGIRGLSGIPRVRPMGHAVLIRPLLGVRRAELQAYLGALGQPYCRDPSNAELRFTRNRVRRQLLPLLRRHFNAEVDAAILRLGLLAGEAQELIDGLVESWVDRCARMEGGGAAVVELAPLEGQPKCLLRELLISVWRRAGWPMQSMGLAQWEQLAGLALLAAGRKTLADGPPQSFRRDFPGPVSVEIGDGALVLRSNVPPRRERGLGTDLAGN